MEFMNVSKKNIFLERQTSEENKGRSGEKEFTNKYPKFSTYL